jgi:hypothetical protein
MKAALFAVGLNEMFGGALAVTNCINDAFALVRNSMLPLFESVAAERPN